MPENFAFEKKCAPLDYYSGTSYLTFQMVCTQIGVIFTFDISVTCNETIVHHPNSSHLLHSNSVARPPDKYLHICTGQAGHYTGLDTRD